MINSIKILLLIIFTIIFTSCSSREIYYNNKIGQIPSVNKTSTIYTGDIVYKNFNYTAISGAKLMKPYHEKLTLAEIVINPENKFYTLKIDDKLIYCSEEKLIKQIGTNDFICLRDSNNDFIFDEYSNLYAIVWNKLSNEAKYKPYDISIKSGFIYELIYNGISNNTIHLEYREYINDIARPSYYQNLQYEFKGETINIRYKDIKIKVYEANNNEIKYEILK